MNSTNKGGLAFPVAELDGDGEFLRQPNGMTLRDYFAAKAMPVYLQLMNQWQPDGLGDDEIREIAGYSYQLADAMLEARAA